MESHSSSRIQCCMPQHWRQSSGANCRQPGEEQDEESSETDDDDLIIVEGLSKKERGDDGEEAGKRGRGRVEGSGSRGRGLDLPQPAVTKSRVKRLWKKREKGNIWASLTRAHPLSGSEIVRIHEQIGQEKPKEIAEQQQKQQHKQQQQPRHQQHQQQNRQRIEQIQQLQQQRQQCVVSQTLAQPPVRHERRLLSEQIQHEPLLPQEWQHKQFKISRNKELLNQEQSSVLQQQSQHHQDQRQQQKQKKPDDIDFDCGRPRHNPHQCRKHRQLSYNNTERSLFVNHYDVHKALSESQGIQPYQAIRKPFATDYIATAGKQRFQIREDNDYFPFSKGSTGGMRKETPTTSEIPVIVHRETSPEDNDVSTLLTNQDDVSDCHREFVEPHKKNPSIISTQYDSKTSGPAQLSALGSELGFRSFSPEQSNGERKRGTSPSGLNIQPVCRETTTSGPHIAIAADVVARESECCGDVSVEPVKCSKCGRRRRRHRRESTACSSNYTCETPNENENLRSDANRVSVQTQTDEVHTDSRNNFHRNLSPCTIAENIQVRLNEHGLTATASLVADDTGKTSSEGHQEDQEQDGSLERKRLVWCEECNTRVVEFKHQAIKDWLRVARDVSQSDSKLKLFSEQASFMDPEFHLPKQPWRCINTKIKVCPVCKTPVEHLKDCARRMIDSFEKILETQQSKLCLDAECPSVKELFKPSQVYEAKPPKMNYCEQLSLDSGLIIGLPIKCAADSSPPANKHSRMIRPVQKSIFSAENSPIKYGFNSPCAVLTVQSKSTNSLSFNSSCAVTAENGKNVPFHANRTDLLVKTFDKSQVSLVNSKVSRRNCVEIFDNVDVFTGYMPKMHPQQAEPTSDRLLLDGGMTALKPRSATDEQYEKKDVASFCCDKYFEPESELSASSSLASLTSDILSDAMSTEVTEAKLSRVRTPFELTEPPLKSRVVNKKKTSIARYKARRTTGMTKARLSEGLSTDFTSNPVDESKFAEGNSYYDSNTSSQFQGLHFEKAYQECNNAKNCRQPKIRRRIKIGLQSLLARKKKSGSDSDTSFTSSTEQLTDTDLFKKPAEVSLEPELNEAINLLLDGCIAEIDTTLSTLSPTKSIDDASVVNQVNKKVDGNRNQSELERKFNYYSSAEDDIGSLPASESNKYVGNVCNVTQNMLRLQDIGISDIQCGSATASDPCSQSPNQYWAGFQNICSSAGRLDTTGEQRPWIDVEADDSQRNTVLNNISKLLEDLQSMILEPTASCEDESYSLRMLSTEHPFSVGGETNDKNTVGNINTVYSESHSLDEDAARQDPQQTSHFPFQSKYFESMAIAAHSKPINTKSLTYTHTNNPLKQIASTLCCDDQYAYEDKLDDALESRFLECEQVKPAADDNLQETQPLNDFVENHPALDNNDIVSAHSLSFYQSQQTRQAFRPTWATYDAQSHGGRLHVPDGSSNPNLYEPFQNPRWKPDKIVPSNNPGFYTVSGVMMNRCVEGKSSGGESCLESFRHLEQPDFMLTRKATPKLVHESINTAKYQGWKAMSTTFLQPAATNSSTIDSCDNIRDDLLRSQKVRQRQELKRRELRRERIQRGKFYQNILTSTTNSRREYSHPTFQP